jgi:hypothetical protein
MKRRLFVALMVASALTIGMVGAGSVVGYKGKGTEGCTPGYWKVPVHQPWTSTAYSPEDLFSSVFENAFPGKTLNDVLWQGGGGLNALGRHTVAALLNASSSGVDFYWNTTEVINAFNAAYPGGNYNALAGLFETENEKGCPLS